MTPIHKLTPIELKIETVEFWKEILTRELGQRDMTEEDLVITFTQPKWKVIFQQDLMMLKAFLEGIQTVTSAPRKE